MGESVTFESAGGSAVGYLARPGGPPRAGVPGVLVLHAWWGLTDHFKRVCDRLAAHGYVALAPDFFGSETAETPERAQELADGASVETCFEIADAALTRLKELAPGKGGVVGFSFGSYFAVWLATKRPGEVAAVVPFYTDTDADVPAVMAPMQWHFAEKDDFVSDEWVKELQQKVVAAGRKDIELHSYPGTEHAFFNASRREAYKPEAAELAWSRMLRFFDKHLG